MERVTGRFVSATIGCVTLGVMLLAISAPYLAAGGQPPTPLAEEEIKFRGVSVRTVVGFPFELEIPAAPIGFIGIQDFRGDIIRCFAERGWIYHSEVAIWKDPVTAMQRTKALGLLHKQIVKDSCMSRQGIPDYVCTFRKPGDNPDPVEGELDRWCGDDSFKSEGRLSIDIWQKYASPIWSDIRPNRTLQYRAARETDDERHICPLQLDVIERCMQLWSNPDDVVLSPFAGIGSEGYVAVEMGRRFVGFELKESYYRQACKNLVAAESKLRETMLF